MFGDMELIGRLNPEGVLPGSMVPVELAEERETEDLPENPPHQEALNHVSERIVTDASLDKPPSLFAEYPWPFWADMSLTDVLDFYKEQIKLAAKAGGLAQVNALRAHFAEQDIFFMLVFILERKDLVHPWLYARAREFQKSPNGHLDLWAREHGKSSIITLGGCIWEVIRNAEVTIGIFSHTKPVAKKFLAQIKGEFEQKSELFNTLWPDTFWANPKKEAPKWSEDDGIIVKRKSNPKEATIEGHGLVDGQPTGRHFMLRVYDDVVTLESVNTTEQIQKTTYGWQMSDNLGTEGGAERYVGTRYHKFDTYHTMMAQGSVIPRIHTATDDGTETGKSVLMHPATLAKKRRDQGPYVFSSQMLQNPLADAAMGFKGDWLVHEEIPYADAITNLFRVIIVDPAGSKQRKNNDYTTFWVLGYGADRRWHTLEMVRDRMNLSGRTNTLFRLHKYWKPHRVAYEEYGLQADIEHIQYVQTEKLYKFEIIPLGGGMSKTNRILRLVPYFEQGRITLPFSMIYKDYTGTALDMVKVFKEEEYLSFPVLSHDDMLDGLARICDAELMIEEPSDNHQVTSSQAYDLESSLRQRGFDGTGYSIMNTMPDNDSYMTA